MTRALEGMPLYFIQNRGRLDSRVAYYVQGRDTTLYFTAEGMTLVQTERKRGEKSAKGGLEKASLGRGIPQTPDPVSRWVVKLDFVGANPSPKITGGDKLPPSSATSRGRRRTGTRVSQPTARLSTPIYGRGLIWSIPERPTASSTRSS